MGHTISSWFRAAPAPSPPSISPRALPLASLPSETNATFNLERYKDKLPASVFLWSDRVPEGSKAKYFQHVGELYQLFITPLNYRRKQFSFLKLYEKRFANRAENRRLKNEIVRLLKHHNSTLFIGLAKLYIQRGQPVVSQVHLFDQLEMWLQSDSHVAVIQLNLTVTLGKTIGHDNTLVLHRKQVKNKKFHVFDYMVIDPQGFEGTEESQSYEIVQNVIREWLKGSLQARGYFAKQILLFCPALQLNYQGNNCTQWFLLLLAFFVSHPDAFEKADEMIAKLGENPTLNIHLFGLCLFMRTLPTFDIISYLDVLELPRTEEEQFAIFKEDAMTRKWVSRELFKMQNCYYFTDKAATCPSDCVPCFENEEDTGTCNFPASVHYLHAAQQAEATETKTQCRSLTPQEIFNKMQALFQTIYDLSHPETKAGKRELAEEKDEEDRGSKRRRI